MPYIPLPAPLKIHVIMVYILHINIIRFTDHQHALTYAIPIGMCCYQHACVIDKQHVSSMTNVCYICHWLHYCHLHASSTINLCHRLLTMFIFDPGKYCWSSAWVVDYQPCVIMHVLCITGCSNISHQHVVLLLLAISKCAIDICHQLWHFISVMITGCIIISHKHRVNITNDHQHVSSTINVWHWLSTCVINYRHKSWHL